MFSELAKRLVWGLLLCGCSSLASAQYFTVRGNVAIDNSRARDKSNIVAWLDPISDASSTPSLGAQPSLARHFRLKQRNRRFEPHLLVVPVGSSIDFPNEDYVFHNVFSLFNGQRFDLGLYEAGKSRKVAFEKPGISYIFCNIHKEMTAVVVSLATPYSGISDVNGLIKIASVPAGHYRLSVWAEGASEQVLASLSHELTVPENLDLGRIQIAIAPGITLTHLNKYGLEYDAQRNNATAGYGTARSD